MRLPPIRYQVSGIKYQVSKKGFTLIELLIVMAIIAILISIGLAAFTRAQAQARDGQRRSELRNYQGALEQYYSDYNVYPGAGIGNLKSELEGGNPDSIVYLREVVTTDPQGNSYNYTGGGQTYCLGSANMETVANDSESCGGDDYGYVLTPQD